MAVGGVRGGAVCNIPHDFDSLSLTVPYRLVPWLPPPFQSNEKDVLSGTVGMGAGRQAPFANGQIIQMINC